MPAKSPWKRISASFRKLFLGNYQNLKHNSKPAQPALRVRISYPQCVESSAPISPPPHRKKSFYKSKFRPTIIEEDACSDASFTCVGLRDFREVENQANSPILREPSTTCEFYRSLSPLLSIGMLISETVGPSLVDDNRISRWSISDYFRDSFILTVPDASQDHILGQNNSTKTKSREYSRDSIGFRHSDYDDLFNTEISQQSEVAPLVINRGRRWSGETEDVPDRYQPYGRHSRHPSSTIS